MSVILARGRYAAPAALLILFGAVGCRSGLYPVQGTVTLEDGTALTDGMVVFESMDGKKLVTARADVQADGSYQLGTNQPGDGAPPGKYRVLVAPREDIDAPQQRAAVFDARYLDFKTSGLEFEVKTGQNDFPIRLTRPAPVTRR